MKNQYQPIPVETARQIANQFDKDWCVILAYNREHNLTHTVTYGRAPEDKVDAANFGEIAARAIGCDTTKKDFNEDFRRDLDAAKQAALKEVAKSCLNFIERLGKTDDNIVAISAVDGKSCWASIEVSDEVEALLERLRELTA